MNPGTALAVMLVAASVLGCTHSSSDSVSVALKGTPRNAGQIGRVTLTDMGATTNLSFYITGVPTGTILPPKLYSFINKGSCQQPGAVAFAMNDQVNSKSDAGTKGWSFYRSAPVPLAELMSGAYSIVVRSAPSDGNADLYCGDVAHASG
ncbi:hypothetical protein [Pseudomonas sp. MYb118]|uniref:hypothetical protein n=1 Tax=Pseudomonas sp. MYb118 TaxID=1848720 RepID=UPI0034CDEF05